MMNLSKNRSRGAWSVAMIVLAAGLLSGCAKDKPAPAAKAAPPPPPKPVSLTQIKAELQDAKTQMMATTDSLNKLHKSSAQDAQANYDAFTGEYLKLKSKADGVSKRSEEIKSRASAYFAMWNQQAQVENPELKRQAMAERANAERTYNEVVNELELTRMSFKPYMSNLTDVGNYLRGRLSPATIGSTTDLVTKANSQSMEVGMHVDKVTKAIDSITTGTGEGAAGITAVVPPQPPPTPAAPPAAK
jgi:hypothetical protein